MLDLMRMFEELSAMPATPKVNVDILNESDHYEIHADLPGYAKEDISIEFKDGMLTITAEKKKSYEESKKDYIRVTRSISVGDINPATLKASMQNGTLIITFPKMEEAPKTRKITID